MKNLFVIPCCKRKIRGGEARNENTPLTYFEDIDQVPNLVNARNEKINSNNLDHPDILLKAWDRYDGTIYRKLKEGQQRIDKLMAKGCLDIVIVSALYGVINYNTPIANYDLAMKQEDIIHWGNSISEAINNYCINHKIDEVFTFLAPTTYYPVTNRSLRDHQKSWPVDPNGNAYHGAKNVYNHLAALMTSKLIDMEIRCFKDSL